jgi:6-phosphofructokinase 1
VINASLLGAIDACRGYPGRTGRIFAAYHGIEGVLKEELLDLSAQPEDELGLLRNTPAAGAIGTCRYKVKQEQEEDLARIIEVFRAHDIGYFFYIGGNDSMDTANRVSELARARDLPLVCTGIPKTIDNDLGDQAFQLMDHTPGYGSVARYWTYMIQNLDEENRGSCPSDPVIVVQAMGRRIGFIPAACRLADPNRESPLQIYLPESELGLPEIAENVSRCVHRHGRAILVVSEGLEVGKLGERTDSFGHGQFGTAKRSVAQAVVDYLNDNQVLPHGATRWQVPGTDQRNAAIYASTVDLDEAYRVGIHAVKIAMETGTGYMATITRESDEPYIVDYGRVSLAEMANSERRFPAEWLTEDKIDVRDDFLRYARPLIGADWPPIPLTGGIQRFARLKPIFAEKKCEAFTPEAYRTRSS